MRRADRLFQVIQLLRRRNVATAAWLAQELEVSERTIYRDVRDLVLSGVPIEGEAGVGYYSAAASTSRRSCSPTPRSRRWCSARASCRAGATPVSRKAAGDALARVESVLPERLQARLNGTPLFAPGFHVRTHVAEALTTLRGAIESRRTVHIEYTSLEDAETERDIRPLGLFFWGSSWSLAALVRAATGVPQLPARPHALAEDARPAFLRRARPPPRGLLRASRRLRILNRSGGT